MLNTLHIPSLLAAVAASMVIGAVWYSPMAFGKQWMALVGLTEKQMQKNSPGRAMAICLVLTVVFGALLQSILKRTSADTLLESFSVVWPFWLLVVIPLVIHELFEGRSWRLMALNAAYQAVNVFAMGAVLVVWR
ncbi:MAG: hypothetical protein G01um101425_1033 [Candidatus Peregrinibacteria bacterium Gr01-1014_25]|nr:MAG: hypothetical protein G01um101425_1033 [Candidatus Peregrinibacteria bacterium Gr01-1014_25]